MARTPRATKGTALLGVRAAVVAKSYERIHRSNLIDMGVLPLQFQDGQNADALGLSDEETFTIAGLAGTDASMHSVHVRAINARGEVKESTPSCESTRPPQRRINAAVASCPICCDNCSTRSRRERERCPAARVG